jgi:polyvinyl alcohol dehydrogenase (cytochrome)
MRAASFLIALLIPCACATGVPSGEEVYKKRCWGCHEQVNPRIPPREALQRMPSARILRALDSGAMMAIAFTLHRDERIAVADYLGTKETIPGPAASAFCSDRTVKLSANPSGWNGWSSAAANWRFQSSELAGLSVEGVRKLKLKWAFGFDGDVTAFAPPTVLDGHLFVGSAGGVVHAMRAESGCPDWVYQANGPVRSSITVAPLEGGSRHALLFGDMTGWFYALAAESGKLLWKVRVEDHDSTRLTGAPVVHKGVVYVPVASWEETRSLNPEYACCTFRGSVVALRIPDGEQLWKTYMVDPPKETGQNARGISLMGPSGVGVWSAPTLDEKRGVLYVTTGDNYSRPATELSDSVVALDLATGRVVWSKQMTAGDIFNGCRGDPVDCPGGGGPDFDFGSSAIAVTLPAGRQLLLAGQKSGIVYALDPDKKGEVVWQTRVGKGGTNGGVQWGMSTDGQFVYAAVSDPGRTRQNNMLDTRRYALDPTQGGGLTALRVADGSKVWYAAPTPCPAGAPAGCSPSQPAAVTGIPGAVFSGAVDGHMRAFSSEDGKLLWDFDTVREFPTVNGVKAHGGSIDGPGAVVVKGMVFINSGYPRNGGLPGNVLLAFEGQ